MRCDILAAILSDCGLQWIKTKITFFELKVDTITLNSGYSRNQSAVAELRVSRQTTDDVNWIMSCECCLTKYETWTNLDFTVSPQLNPISGGVLHTSRQTTSKLDSITKSIGFIRKKRPVLTDQSPELSMKYSHDVRHRALRLGVMVAAYPHGLAALLSKVTCTSRYYCLHWGGERNRTSFSNRPPSEWSGYAAGVLCNL